MQLLGGGIQGVSRDVCLAVIVLAGPVGAMGALYAYLCRPLLIAPATVL
jgi:hypothetical protein